MVGDVLLATRVHMDDPCLVQAFMLIALETLVTETKRPLKDTKSAGCAGHVAPST